MSQYALPFITKRGRREHRRRTKTKRAYLVTVQGKTPCFVSAHDLGEATSTVLHAVKVIAGPKITPIDLRIRRVPALDPWAIHAQPKPETAESLAAEFPISIERLRDIIEAAKPRPTAPISPWTRPGPDKSAWAVLDQERHYRYVLWRQWDCGLPYVAFIGVNPSTADEVTDDATIRVCRGYAERWGYGGLAMVNLFAFRATDPKVMKAEPNCVGPRNNEALLAVCLGAAKVVCAWGNNGTHCNRDFAVADTLRKAGIPLYALKLTNDGHPCHPLRQKADLDPIVYKGGLGQPIQPAEIPKHLQRHEPPVIPPPAGYDSWEAYHVAGLHSATPAPASETPLQKSLRELRAKAPEGSLIAIRLGDFYEFFGADARAVASGLTLALTKRNGVEMTGVPYHVVDQWFTKLTEAGHTIAIAEAREIIEVRAPAWQDAAAKGMAESASKFLKLIDGIPPESLTDEDCERLASFLARKPEPETDEQRALKAELLAAAQRTTQLTQ